MPFPMVPAPSTATVLIKSMAISSLRYRARLRIAAGNNDDRKRFLRSHGGECKSLVPTGGIGQSPQVVDPCPNPALHPGQNIARGSLLHHEERKNYEWFSWLKLVCPLACSALGCVLRVLGTKLHHARFGPEALASAVP